MQDCVFFESALHLRRGPHMAVECVPVPEEAGEMAPMYFQKAIQVSGPHYHSGHGHCLLQNMKYCTLFGPNVPYSTGNL